MLDDEIEVVLDVGNSVLGDHNSLVDMEDESVIYVNGSVVNTDSESVLVGDSSVVDVNEGVPDVDDEVGLNGTVKHPDSSKWSLEPVGTGNERTAGPLMPRTP